MKGYPACRQSPRRLDREADPPGRPHHLHLSEQTYGLNQLRYDLRKLKGHGLIERDGFRYAYRLTPKGVQVALLFLFFHKRLCGPLANSRFHHEPDQNTAHIVSSKPHTTAPTKPSTKLSSCWQPPDRANINVEVALFENIRVKFKSILFLRQDVDQKSAALRRRAF